MRTKQVRENPFKSVESVSQSLRLARGRSPAVSAPSPAVAASHNCRCPLNSRASHRGYQLGLVAALRSPAAPPDSQMKTNPIAIQVSSRRRLTIAV